MSAAGLARRAGRCALVAAAALGALGLLLVATALVTGNRAFVIRSGSMQPAIGTGALVIGHRVPAAALHPGEVVTVPTGHGGYVTHRVVGVHRDGPDTRLTLRGDANPTADPVPYTAPYGYRSWLVIPGVGYLLAGLVGPAALAVLGGVGVWLVTMLARSLRGCRWRVRVATAGVLAAALVAAGSVAGRPWLSAAAWTDSVAVSGAQLRALTVNPSAAFNCGTLGVLSVRFTWTAVPGATGYTLHYGANGVSTRAIAAGVTDATITTAISGGKAWIVANRNFGSVTWSSVASQTRTYTVAVVSLCA